MYTIDFGIPESELAHHMSYAEHFNIEALKLGVMGVTVVAVAGTYEYVEQTGSSCTYDPMFPASSPYVTSVGSTIRFFATSLSSENDKDLTEKPYDDDRGRYIYNIRMISVGGFSKLFSSPTYQHQSISSYTKNMNNLRHSIHNHNGRGYPDITIMNSDYLHVSESKRECLISPRTSAYLFSDMVSRINIARQKAGASPLGFLNPALYSNHNKNASFIRDITSSDSGCIGSSRCCADGLSVAVGWDPVSGIGSVDLDMMYKHFVGSHVFNEQEYEYKYEYAHTSNTLDSSLRQKANNTSLTNTSSFSTAILESHASSLTGSASYYYYTGSYQEYVVPSGVYKLSVSAYGGQGGSTHTAAGGAGGHILADISVTPGQILYVYVGGAGGTNGAGYNGGGMSYDGCGGGGGGASDVRTAVGDLYSRLVVAGGGGGAGTGRDRSKFCMYGGSGGGYIGGSEEGPVDSRCYSGGGGSLYSGGTAGYVSSYSYGSAGSYGYGGDTEIGICGGGGGGGYFGGGGGAWTGGGGGSSYAKGTIRINEQGINSGNGHLSIQRYSVVTTTSTSINDIVWPPRRPIPTRQPTPKPTLNPFYLWVQGQVQQSCSAACASVHSSCVPWEPRRSKNDFDFPNAFSHSIDLSTCNHLPAYGDCSKSRGGLGFRLQEKLQGNPAGNDNFNVWSADWMDACNVMPVGYFRRFCRCFPVDSPPAKFPTSRPFTMPVTKPTTLPFYSSGTLWVHGQRDQSCIEACNSISSHCVPSGQWPNSMEDFKTILSTSVDLSTCHQLPAYGNCSGVKNCQGVIARGSSTLQRNPEGSSQMCFYGGGAGSCDALPEVGFRRYCPCRSEISPSSTVDSSKTRGFSVSVITAAALSGFVLLSLCFGFLSHYYVGRYNRDRGVVGEFEDDHVRENCQRDEGGQQYEGHQLLDMDQEGPGDVEELRELEIAPLALSVQSNQYGKDSECVVCFQNIHRAQIPIVCRGAVDRKHYMHRDCFSLTVSNQLAVNDRIRFRENNRKIVCPNCFGAYKDKDIITNVDNELWNLFLEARDDVQRQITEEELQRRVKEEEDKRRQAAGHREGRVERHRNYIVENILTLKCPRCRQAILDFQEGDCFAIRCACRCSFCGWCLADCGNDAHPHVRACPLNPRPNDIYGSVAEFHHHHNARKRQSILQYIDSNLVAVEDRRYVLQAVREDLHNVGLEVI